MLLEKAEQQVYGQPTQQYFEPYQLEEMSQMTEKYRQQFEQSQIEPENMLNVFE